MAIRHYLHGDYLEPEDRNPSSSVYCAFCDGYCLPEHLYSEHAIAESFVRLNASRKAYYRTKKKVERPEGAPNYFDGNPDPT